jgi:hydroxymethylbilane synthase
LDDTHTRKVVLGERAFLHRLEGGCQVPIAGHGHLKNNTYTLAGLVCDVDGTQRIKASLTGSADQSQKIGVELAETLLSKGAGEILERLNANANE